MRHRDLHGLFAEFQSVFDPSGNQGHLSETHQQSRPVHDQPHPLSIGDRLLGEL